MAVLESFLLPDVGEGLLEAEIVTWRVQVGDVVVLNQVLVEIETAKSLVELPSPWAGVVSEILVVSGEMVAVGSCIVRISVDGSDGLPDKLDSSGSNNLSSSLGSGVSGSVGVDGSGVGNFVGSGPVPDSLVARKRKKFSSRGGVLAVSVQDVVSVRDVGGAVLSTPPVRKLARDLEVDIYSISGTGIGGRVVREDVLRAAGRGRNLEVGSGVSGGGVRDFVGFSGVAGKSDGGGLEERVVVRGVRKVTAEAMVKSAFSAPHVSVFVDVDMTRTVEFVAKLRDSEVFGGVKVSYLLVVLRAVLWAIERNPSVNSSWLGDEIVYKKYVNLGVAVATDRGLLVPNIKSAHEMSLIELAASLQDMISLALSGKTDPKSMLGGTVTVSNIGSLGLDFGTPILNSGEVAIVAFGSVKLRPWVVDGVVVPRWITTLGASLDHRVVDGDVAAKFLVDVGRILDEPALLLG